MNFPPDFFIVSVFAKENTQFPLESNNSSFLSFHYITVQVFSIAKTDCKCFLYLDPDFPPLLKIINGKPNDSCMFPIVWYVGTSIAVGIESSVPCLMAFDRSAKTAIPQNTEVRSMQ